MSKKIVIVDDSIYMRTLVREALTTGGFQISAEAANGKSALEMIKEHQPDLVTLDNVLPDMMGLDVLKEIRKINPKIKVLLVSAVGQQTIKNKGIQLGASGYIVKPFSIMQILDETNRILSHEDDNNDRLNHLSLTKAI